MERLEFTENLPYSIQDVHDVIMDPARYKELSSMIKRIDVEEHGTHRKDVDVTIEAPVIPFAIHYGCVLESDGRGAITARATKSPFKEMGGTLTLSELPDGGTQVHCRIDYRTGWNPVAMAASKVMESQIGRGIAYARDYLAGRLTPVDAAQNVQHNGNNNDNDSSGGAGPRDFSGGPPRP